MKTPTDKDPKATELGDHSSLYIDEELSARIDALAAKHGVTRKEMLDTLVRRGLEIETDKLRPLTQGDR
jgi:hypothetical protein